MLYFNQFSGQEIAIVQGAMNNCGDQDFPSIFVRLDDPEILDFIKSVVDGIKTKGKANLKLVKKEMVTVKCVTQKLNLNRATT